MSKKPLSFVERVFLKAVNPVFGRVQGWRQDAINEEFVRTYGVRGFVKFGKTIGDTIAFLADKYGEAEAHHLVGFAGMMNGCRWCGVGHTLTANLLIFQDGEALFPIDERELPELQLLDDDAILEVFRERLHATPWASLVSLLERIKQLRGGEERTDSDDDVYLGLALDLWDWTNECTIETGFDIKAEDVPTLALLNRDKALHVRYRAARDAT
ncbi:MAG: hypothetical protein AB8H86_12115 [Polyangiales bacterium]